MYHQSFNVDDKKGAKDFFDTNGYVVIDSVFTKEECQQVWHSVGEIISEKEEKFNINDLRTYEHAPILNRHGMYTKRPVFNQVFIDLRQNKKLADMAKHLMDQNNIIVSHDRFIFLRPTTDHPEWKTPYEYPNVHLDMSPHTYFEKPFAGKEFRNSLAYEDTGDLIGEASQYHTTEGVRLQGIINIIDNAEEDGGFICVPSFDIDSWYMEKRLNEFDRIKDLGRYDFKRLSSIDMRYVHRPIRITKRHGSVVLWDRTMAHSGKPNESKRPRLGIPIAYTPKHNFSKDTLSRRSKLLKKIVDDNGIIVNDTGSELFFL